MNPVVLTEIQWRSLQDSIAAYSGMALDNTRRRSVEAVLAERCAQLSCDDPVAYLAAMTSAELHAVVEMLCNHETQFFRTPLHYRALREHVLPELNTRRSLAAPLRCWSAGCSTGEEAYSLAITALAALPPSRPVQIYASDLSNTALMHARAGRYRGRTLANVAPADLNRYFSPDDDWSVVKPEVAAIIQWYQHNLYNTLPSWATDLDLVLCQNVTIYFSVDTCRELMGRIFQSLRPGGYLVIGYSETLWHVFEGFELQSLGGTFMYRKPLAAAIPPPRRQRRAPNDRQPFLADAASGSAPPTPHQLLDQARTLLATARGDEALALLLAVPVEHTCFAAARTLIGRIYADRGEWDRATAEAVCALEHDLTAAEANLLLGIIAAHRQQWPAAVESLQRSQYLDPANPLPSFHLADAYRAQGRAELAGREYRAALRRLAPLEETALLDGVSVGWLRASCTRAIQQLGQFHRRSSMG
ncbi:MAG: protein-glutamate O-methyltransferase CheR [Herpetosiphon sp.]